MPHLPLGGPPLLLLSGFEENTAAAWRIALDIVNGSADTARTELATVLASAPSASQSAVCQYVELLSWAASGEERRLDEAEAELTRLRELYPLPSLVGATASVALASVRMLEGRVAEAASMLATVRQSDAALPFGAFAHFLELSALIELSRGDVQAAVQLGLQVNETARAAISGPTLVFRLMNSGIILLEGGMAREARDNFIAALKLSDKFRGAFGALSAAMAALASHAIGDAIEAHRFMTIALSNPESDPHFRLYRSAVGIEVGLSIGDPSLIELSRDDGLAEQLQGSRFAFPALLSYQRLHYIEGRTDNSPDNLALMLEQRPWISWPVLWEIASKGNATAVDAALAQVSKLDKANGVTLAKRWLFEALVESRAGNRAQAVKLAEQSYELFLDLGLRPLAAQSLEVAGRFNEAFCMYELCGFAGDAGRLKNRRRRGRPRRDVSIGDWHRELTRLIAANCTNAQIAQRTGLSPKTIERRIADLYAITGVTSRSALCLLIGEGWGP